MPHYWPWASCPRHPSCTPKIPSATVIEREVPALKDGTRLGVADIERAILAACARHKFRATVVAPGVIEARRRWSNSVVVMIPYSDEGFSIQPKPATSSEHVAGLAEYIEADLARELVRLKSLQKPVRRSAAYQAALRRLNGDRPHFACKWG